MDVTTLFKEAWGILDEKEEQVTIAAEDNYDLTAIIKDKVGNKTLSGSTRTAEQDKHTEQPNLQFPLQEMKEEGKATCFTEIFSFFGSQKKMPYDIAEKIIQETKVLFEKMNTAVVDIEVPKDGRLIVCGDTHGQFTDLTTIFHKFGKPSPKNVYLFNGDFVDRGPNCAEVLLTLYIFKNFFPTCIFMNRGNHENARLNYKYNFEDQILERYDAAMFDSIEETFSILPLCHVISDKVLVVHGGLTDEEVTIDDLRKLPWRKQLPRHRDIVERGDRIMEHLLWSDPKSISGTRPSTRGAGVHFGEDVTASFLERNNLELIIRSHELANEGYEEHHSGKLYTLFSASNYSLKNVNRGAVAIFDGKAAKPTKPTFWQYFAELPSGLDLAEEQKNETLEHLRERIFENRATLMQQFLKIDTNKAGAVTVEQWAAALKDALQLPINWKGLQPYLAKLNEEGNIEYVSFIERFRVKLDKTLLKTWSKSMISSICRTLYAVSNCSADAFAKFDKNGDGVISYDEFKAGLDSFALGLTDAQVYDLIRKIDRDDDGQINLMEFSRSFKLRTAPPAKLDAYIDEIGKSLFTKTGKTRLSSVFRLFDTDKNKNLSHQEFSEALVRLGFDFPEDIRLQLASFVDSNGSGRISKREFKGAFATASSIVDDHIEATVLQEISRTIFAGRVQLKRAFRLMDTDGNGEIDVEEFKIALEALNICTQGSLSDFQIKKIHSAMDADGNGTVNYQEFLDCFQVTDQLAQ